MVEILILACSDCDHIYDQEIRDRCPRCDSNEYEIVDVEETED